VEDCRLVACSSNLVDLALKGVKVEVCWGVSDCFVDELECCIDLPLEEVVLGHEVEEPEEDSWVLLFLIFCR
jgi:hypothetical protein